MKHDRRTFIKSVTASGIVGGLTDVTAARNGRESQSNETYYTKIDSISFGGYYTTVQELPGQRERIQTTDFLVPDLSVTPYTVDQTTLSGISTGASGSTITVTTDEEPTLEDVNRQKIPVTEADRQFDSEVVGYRMIGDLHWETVGGSDDDDVFAGEPSHVEYLISETLPNGEWNGFIDVSEGCSTGGTSGYSWKYPRHRILTRINPRAEYEIFIDTRRGAVEWTLDITIQAVVASPRPTYGNDNGFRRAGQETFETDRATSMSDIDGYTVATNISTDAEISSEDTVVELHSSPFWGVRSCNSRFSRRGQTMAGDMESIVEPGSYRYIIEPQNMLSEWDIDLNVYKRVVT